MEPEFTFPREVIGPSLIEVADSFANFGHTVENILDGNGQFGNEFVEDAIAAGHAISQMLTVCNDYMTQVGPHYLAFKAFFDALHGEGEFSDATHATE